jgi:hypothetical protein
MKVDLAQLVVGLFEMIIQACASDHQQHIHPGIRANE